MADVTSLADAPNTLREYETIYILRPDTVNEKVADVNERVRGIIESRGGKVLSVDNWGKRKLAYEVKKELKGIYLYWQYLASTDVVAEFERNMRMLDSVVRYMTVQVAQDIDPGARESQIDEESYTRAATTAADEEELMLGRGASDAEGEESEGAEARAEGEGEGSDAQASGASEEGEAEAAPSKSDSSEEEE